MDGRQPRAAKRVEKADSLSFKVGERWAMAMKDKRSPLEHALHDGEDYELLVTGTDALRHERFLLTAVGRIVARGDEHRPVLTLVHPDGRREPLEPQGYEHFR